METQNQTLLTPERLDQILENYAADDAALLIRAIHGILEPSEPPHTVDWSDIAQSLALAAIACTFIIVVFS